MRNERDWPAYVRLTLVVDTDVVMSGLCSCDWSSLEMLWEGEEGMTGIEIVLEAMVVAEDILSIDDSVFDRPSMRLVSFVGVEDAAWFVDLAGEIAVDGGECSFA